MPVATGMARNTKEVVLLGSKFRNMHGIGKALKSISSSLKIYDFVTVGDEVYQDWLRLSSFVREETTETEGRIGYIAHFKDSKNSKWSIKTYGCDPGPLRYGINELRFVGYVKHNGRIVGKPKVRYEKYLKTRNRRETSDYIIVQTKEE